MKKAPPSLWERVNSPFFIFVMSTIVVGMFSYAAQTYSDFNKQRIERATKISHLLTELSYRVDLMSAMEAQKFRYTELFSANGAIHGHRGNIDGNQRLIGDFSAIYPEFDDRTFMSLMWDLRDQTKDHRLSKNMKKYDMIINKISYIWDDHTRLLDARINTTEDSVWGFTDTNSQEQFINYTEYLRKDLRSIRTDIEPDLN